MAMVAEPRGAAQARVTFSRVLFRNFKALSDFSVTLRDLNVLVGPNNSGKSTIISAFRVLAAGLRRARATRPVPVDGTDGRRALGYPIATEALPLSMENVHTNYDEDVPTTVRFILSNRGSLTLHFPAQGGCTMFAESEAGRVPTAPSEFNRLFPVSVGAIPVLGPVEHDESPVRDEVVRRNLATHRASRNFRSYWFHNPEKFDEFRERLEESWPGMTIQRPELLGSTLAMFCLEGRERLPREVFWAGFGFQIWCQLLTHVVRESGSTLLVVDEPETYLHPDLQRHLLSILREFGASVLLATHSAEIVSECDPQELLIVDKSQPSAKRLAGIGGIQTALGALGARPNLALTRLARTRRALYVEGEDFTLLRRFAARLQLRALAGTADITDLALEGFRPGDAELLRRGAEEAIGVRVLSAIVLDRDFRPDEEVQQVLGRLRERFDLGHIHRRKEIENYLLVPSVLERVIARTATEEARRAKRRQVDVEPILEVLRSVTDPLKGVALGQYQARRAEYLRSTGIDAATANAQTHSWFEERWADLDRRLEIVPGKETFSALNVYLQERHGISISPLRVIDEFRRSEIPSDLEQLLRELNDFRLRAP